MLLVWAYLLAAYWRAKRTHVLRCDTLKLHLRGLHGQQGGIQYMAACGEDGG